MGNILFSDQDKVSAAIIEGLTHVFGRELRTILQKEADKHVDTIVDSLCDRLKIKLETDKNFLTGTTTLDLTWLIKKE